MIIEVQMQLMSKCNLKTHVKSEKNKIELLGDSLQTKLQSRNCSLAMLCMWVPLHCGEIIFHDVQI